MNIIHFATPQQIDALRKVFCQSKPVYDSDGWVLYMDWDNPAWLDVMDSFCVPSNWR